MLNSCNAVFVPLLANTSSRDTRLNVNPVNKLSKRYDSYRYLILREDAYYAFRTIVG